MKAALAVSVALAIIAASAAALTGSFTGAAAVAEPTPAVTVTVAPPEPEPNVVTEHTLFDVPAAGVPTVEFSVIQDAASGFNVHIETTNFVWAPDLVNGDRVAGEGHAHIYVDGVKIGRFYGPDAHITAGTLDSTFEVYLAAHDHAEFSVDGEAIVGVGVAEPWGE